MEINAQLPTDFQYQGKPGEDPSSPWWTSGNYVGPYWSNGKVQPSVEWGELNPTHALDNLARQHDAAYAHWEDRNHREAADMIFAREAHKLKEKFGSRIADDPRLAAALVEYGNYGFRQSKKIGQNFLTYGPLGLVKSGVENIWEMHKRLSGTHLKKELESVSKYYAAAPKPSKFSSPGMKTVKVAPKASPQLVPENPRTKPPTGGVSAPPGKKVTFAEPNSNPGPHSNLLWPSKQAKKFAKYNALRLAASEPQMHKPVYVKPKLNFDKALSTTYKKKRKKNRWQRASVLPL